MKTTFIFRFLFYRFFTSKLVFNLNYSRITTKPQEDRDQKTATTSSRRSRTPAIIIIIVVVPIRVIKREREQQDLFSLSI